MASFSRAPRSLADLAVNTWSQVAERGAHGNDVTEDGWVPWPIARP